MYERFGTQHLIHEPEVPDEGSHLWRWFWALSSRRQQGFDGPQPISFLEIGTWAWLAGEHILREELHILTGMDDAFLSALAKERSAQRAANEKR